MSCKVKLSDALKQLEIYVPYTGATTDVDLGANDITSGAVNTNYVQFDSEAAPVASVEGLMQWNETDGTLDLGIKTGSVTLQIGQEMFIKVRNVSGASIANGTPVYFSGRAGNRATIAMAQGSGETTCRVQGVTTENIDNNTDGFITSVGYVRQIKTNYIGSGIWGTTWNAGDILYVSKDVAGQLTNVEPQEPHCSDIVGTVGVVGAIGIGSIFINIQRHSLLSELSDVDGTALTTSGQILTWHNTEGYFDFDDNINNYVPYVGATTNVDLDANTLKTASLLTSEIKTDTVAPADLRIITGLDKTLEIDTVVWDDMQVSLGAVVRGVSSPVWEPYKGSEVLSFAPNQSNQIFFTIQYSHRIKDGSETEFHIHTVPPDNTAGGVVWELTVSYSRINAVFPAEVDNKVTQVIEINSLDHHKLVGIKNPFATDVGISTIALCSLTRLGNDAADTYANNIYLIALDSHFQIDTMGSRQRFAK